MIALTQNVPMMAHHIASCQSYAVAEPSAQINAPWRYAALAQLRMLQDTGRRLPGLGDLRISEETSSRARQVLALINISDLPAPEIAPISGGGISSSWTLGNRGVQLMVFSDGEILFQKNQGDTLLDEQDDAPDGARYTAGLNWLLGKGA